MITGWSSGPRKPEPPTMLTPGLRGWRSGIQAAVSPGWTASYNSLYSPLPSGPHPQVRAKEHAHSMLNHMVAAPSPKRSPSLDISLHGTERSREQGGGFSRTLADLTQGSWTPPPSHLRPLAQQLPVKADDRAHLASPPWVQALSQATTSSCLWTRLRSGRFSDRPSSIPASSSSILSILLLPELACFSRPIFVPVCQTRTWARRAWKDFSRPWPAPTLQ